MAGLLLSDLAVDDGGGVVFRASLVSLPALSSDCFKRGTKLDYHGEPQAFFIVSIKKILFASHFPFFIIKFFFFKFTIVSREKISVRNGVKDLAFNRFFFPQFRYTTSRNL